MRKFKAIAMSIAAVLVLAAAPVAFAAANQGNPQGEAGTNGAAGTAAIACDPRMSAANAAGQEIFLSTPNPRLYSSTAWENIECTSTTFRLGFNQRALVVANFNAEADCNGAAGQWCQTRALLGPANGLLSEGRPVAAEPSSFAFDSTAGGSANWQAHSMQRGWEIRCASTAGCQYRFVAQAKKHDATVTSMWLDEVAVALKVTIGAQAPQ